MEPYNFCIPEQFSLKNGEHVYLLQQALTAIDAGKYQIDSQEMAGRIYGVSTQEAVLSFQKDYSLTQNSNTILSDTVSALNGQLETLYRICGFLTDNYGTPIPSIEIQAYYQNEELGKGFSLTNGSYRIYPKLETTLLNGEGLLKYVMNLQLQFFKNSQENILPDSNILIKDKENILYISSDNFLKYVDDPLYTRLMGTLQFNGINSAQLRPMTPSELLTVSKNTEIEMETLMRIMFAQNPYLEFMLGNSYINDVIFGYLYQNYPANVPVQLFDDSFVEMEDTEWQQYKEKIDNLIEKGFILMLPDVLLNVLTLAVSKQYIAFRDDATIKTIVSVIDTYNKEIAPTTYFLEGETTTFEMIFDELDPQIDTEVKQNITRLFIENIMDFDLFIDQLKGVPQLSAQDCQTLTMLFQLSRITRNFMPLITTLLNEEQVSSILGHSISDLADLADVSRQEWETLVLAAYYLPPKDFKNGTEYAEFVWRTYQKLYPNLSVIEDIIHNDVLKDKFDQITEIRQYLINKNPTFNLLTDRLDPSDQEATFVQQFREIQQIYQITPTPEAAIAVLEKNISSTGQIYFMGKKLFEEKLIGELKQEEIDSAFNMATARFSTALNAYVNLKSSLNLDPYVANYMTSANIASYVNELKQEFPDIEKLFGDMDYCECEHDSSVYSAAAYLGDLLTFLDQRIASNNIPFKNYLDYYDNNQDKIRRRDISKIYLNEHNTNAVLPYIDLVCEVLEEAVLKLKYGADYQGRSDKECQTTLTTKELLAAPEHILIHTLESNGAIIGEKTAYDTLAEALYPMFAPLNLWQTEIRAYLQFMGVERYRLMEIFQYDNDPGSSNIAAEYFGLTLLGEAIITQQKPLADRNTAWHTTPQGNPSKMAMTAFLQDSGLSVYETMDLAGYYKNNNSIVIVRWAGISLTDFEDCSYTNKYVYGNGTNFDKAHRFIRLWRHSGWKIWELDLLLRSTITHINTVATGKTDNLDEASLFNLMLFKQQQETLKLSAEELLAFYADINTETIIEKGKEKSCLYDRLFLQKSLSNPLNAKLVAVKAELTQNISLDANDQKLIMACLSLKEPDFALLNKQWNKNEYNISYLNFLYRHSLLAKKLKISVEELFTVFTLLHKTIVSGNTHYTLPDIDTIITTVARIKASKLTVAAYEYLILYTCPQAEAPLSFNAQELVIDEDKLQEYVDILKSILNKEFAPPLDNAIVRLEEVNATGITTERWGTSATYKKYFTEYLLATGQYSSEDIEELIRIIECVSGKTDQEIDAFTARIFASADYIPIQINLHYEVITDETKLRLIPRYKNVGFFVDACSLSATVINTLSAWFNLSAAAVQLYSGYYMASLYVEGAYTSFKEMFLGAFEGSEGRLLLLSMHKAALLINKRKISDTDFALLLDMPEDKQTFNWYSFALSAQNGNTLNDFLQLDALLTLQKQYGTMGEQETLLSLLDKYAYNNKPNTLFFDQLCQLCGWNLLQFKQLIENNLQYTRNDFYHPKTFRKVEQCLDILTKTGVDTSTIEAWKTCNDDSTLKAQQVKEAAKTHYNLDTWLDKLPAVQNIVREAKSHALSSFLIASSWRNTNPSTPVKWNNQTELYNYFLLDTEMKPIMKTSRLVQATLSVQLFVQRCSLGLEAPLTIDDNYDSEWKQWEWMKKYRLWEANRKIFLYPENWIEPELRDDKTPFFQELEEELSQGEVTSELVETAFENYLQKLNDVANLFVCGIYQEVAGDGDDGIWQQAGDKTLNIKTSKVNRLHVIARTRSTPYEYYYRCYDAYDAAWTHWEKIDVDIKGDVVVPVVYNRRLHLFWIFPVSKTYSTEGKDNNTKPTVSHYADIQLGWTVLRNKKWTKAAYSVKKVFLLLDNNHLKEYSLRAEYDPTTNEISLNVYSYSTTPNLDPRKIWSILSGKFYFNGDVYQSIIYIMKQEISDQMVYDERPAVGLNSMDIHLYGKLITDAKLLSSRLYANIPTCYLPYRDDTSFANPAATNSDDCVKLLSTTNKNPNTVLMIHNSPNLELGLRSHDCIPFFYQDSARSFFVMPEKANNKTSYRFYPFYHAYSKLFIKELNRCGIHGLLNRDLQRLPQNFYPRNTYQFKEEYNPTENVVTVEKGHETDIVDFNLSGAYSIYNWELFFHTPLYIACKLSQNQKHEEAMAWFHYIFNPVDKSSHPSPQKFWIFKPFFDISDPKNRAENIRDILKNIKSYAKEVNAWLNNPYKPHLIARTRWVAYQRTVVMKYINNIIEWADQLFRRDTMEYNNEATMLYILAYELLGRRPVMLPKKEVTANRNYEQIKNDNNSFSYLTVYEQAFKLDFVKSYEVVNSIADPVLSQPSYYQQLSAYSYAAERNTAAQKSGRLSFDRVSNAIALLMPPVPVNEAVTLTAQSRSTYIAHYQQAVWEPLPRIDASNFCVPFNDDLLRYWDTVEDRLFKLRNSMNIEGTVRELPLFEPPIDPAMLVRAVAAGLSIGEALNDITARQPYYRFRVIMQKAIEFTGEVKQLGDKLLSALEKKDAETLNILRSTQEITMQQAMKQVRKLQIDEAKENIANIQAMIDTATARKEYYASREFMNSLEGASFGLSIAAGVLDIIAGVGKTVAGGVINVPDFTIGVSGFGGSPVGSIEITGGTKIAGAMDYVMEAISITAHALDRTSALTATQAGYVRRKEEWDFQANMADMELKQLDCQLAAAEIRLMMAEKEMENLDMQIEQSQSVKEYYQSKYTNEALYNWMITQLSSVYYQAYKLAYDMAKKAESCYRHELGIYESTGFIQFGYWDNLKKGLLSGDKLIHDLHVLEAAYLDRNKRALELTKHISLAQMYPGKLIELIATKETLLDLEEFIFDMDYPGHYMRRIKSVSVTIPNVAGPYTSVSFMLTLQDAQVRKEALLKDGSLYEEVEPKNDSRFVYQTSGSVMQSICTSSAQNDSGLFELNFGDERYLPFENAGVISSWKLSFPAACNQFDLSTVSDVILHINYTAFDGGERLAKAAKTALQEKLPEFGTMLLSPKQDFPDAWNLMDQATPQMDFVLKTEHLPFFMRGMEGIAVTAISILLSVKRRADTAYPKLLTFTLKEADIELTLRQQDNGDILIYEGAVSVDTLPALGQWRLVLDHLKPNGIMQNGIALADIEDIVAGFALQTGVEDNGSGSGNGGSGGVNNFLLTNSMDKLTTNNNENIILNNLNS